ncbi:hypothetical protein P4C99_02950 [Pontiellaceae bacterium B1224]|nr:hypothetical protein [Pontiellaceae bacterium B1224]
MRASVLYVIIGFMMQTIAGASATPLYPTLAVTRLSDEPIIDLSSFSALGIADEGDNINGPSCVRIPDWVPEEERAHPSAQYYLYFAHHHGDYIRMAWAAKIEGPWTLFNCGTSNDTRVAGRGVLDLGASDQIAYTGGIWVNNHIASPDVVIDHTNQQFILYFHGKTNGSTAIDKSFDTGTQKTMAATSAYGLNFNLPSGMTGTSGGVGGGETGHGLKNAILGNAYFRTFNYNGTWHALSNYGPIWKAPNTATTWETTNVTADAWAEGPVEGNPVYADLNANYNLHPGAAPRYNTGHNVPNNGAPRHFATLLQDDGKTLEVWYTSRGEMPEHLPDHHRPQRGHLANMGFHRMRYEYGSSGNAASRA